MRGVDEDFAGLGLDALADAALTSARAAGASYAAVRVQQTRSRTVTVRDDAVEGSSDDTALGLAVRVLVDGAWGFAATSTLSPDAAAGAAALAVRGARVARPLVRRPVELADEPRHAGEWVSGYDIDPFDVPPAEQGGLLLSWCTALLPRVAHAEASVWAVKEQKFLADLAGTRTLQQRVRVHPEVTVVGRAPDGRVDTMRTVAPPAGRGWEYVAGTAGTGTGPAGGAPGGAPILAELDELPDLVVEKLAAPSVEPGRYDLVIAPSQLWLTIHESVGHATELDRALGYEAAYAGTTFATPDELGSRAYGSDLMTVTGDRVAPHGLATVGWDDEGVAAGTWDLVRHGVHVGYQLDRAMAADRGVPSNGCAYADEPVHAPLQRMPNVSLAADPAGPDLEGLVGGVTDGIYVVGDRSWSIDMQRYNFQFTAQRFYRVRHGRLAGMLRDVAYQATTTDFWGSLAALGGPGTYSLEGTFGCGKGQPGQGAPVSHGSPAAVFEQVRVLNTEREGR